MSLPIQAAFHLFVLGWAAGVGTALACRPARSAGARRELLVDPRGWRSYAPVSRPRHANSDNGAPSTAKPPIEPQGQAPVKPSFPPPRKIREGFTAEEIQTDNLRPWPELKAEFLAYQANVARIEAEQDSAEAGRASAAARRSGIWQPQATGQGDPLPPQANS